MDAMKIVSTGIFGNSNDVDGTATTVDNWSRGDADLRRHLSAAAVVARQFTRQLRGNHPEGGRRVPTYAIRVKGEDTTVLGSDVQNISHSLTRNGYTREVQRLRIHSAVHYERT